MYIQNFDVFVANPSKVYKDMRTMEKAQPDNAYPVININNKNN